MRKTILISMQGKDVTIHDEARKKLKPETVTAIMCDLWGRVHNPAGLTEALEYAKKNMPDSEITIHKDDPSPDAPAEFVSGKKSE